MLPAPPGSGGGDHLHGPRPDAFPTAAVGGVYSYAVAMNGLADEEHLRLRFDVLTKTKKPELHRYWTTRDRAANLRLFRLVSEILRAIEAGVFHPVVGWHCEDCPYRSRCWAWG